jgi:hypothetical protein
MNYCLNCGSSYNKRHIKHKFCSSRCRTKAHRKKHGIQEIPDFNNLSDRSYLVNPANSNSNFQSDIRESEPFIEEVVQPKVKVKKKIFVRKKIKKKKPETRLEYIERINKEEKEKEKAEREELEKRYKNTLKSMTPKGFEFLFDD